MNLVLIVGPPAVGKFTIGKNIAELLNFGFIHEHNYLDIVQQFGIKKRKKRLVTYFSIWLYTLSQVIKNAEKDGLVSTMVFDFSDKIFFQFLTQTLTLINKHNGYLLLIELSASIDQRLLRNVHPDRLAQKPVKRDTKKTTQQLVNLEHYCVLNAPVSLARKGLLHLKFNTNDTSVEEATKSIYQQINKYI